MKGIAAFLLGAVRGRAMAGEGGCVTEPLAARVAEQPLPPPATGVVREVGGERILQGELLAAVRADPLLAATGTGCASDCDLTLH